MSDTDGPLTLAGAIVIVDRDDGLAILSWGQGLSAYEMMGIFEAAKLNVFADDLADDDE